MAASGPGLPGAAAEVAEVAAVHGVIPRRKRRGRRRWPRSTAPGWPTWPPTGGSTRPTRCSPRSTWPTARLTVYDLERLRTPPKLVVLAACESGTLGRQGGRRAPRAEHDLPVPGHTMRGRVDGAGAGRADPATDDRPAQEGSPPGLPAATALAQTRQEAGDDVTAAGFVCIGADVGL